MAGKQLFENIAEVLQPRAGAKQKHGLQADLQMTRISAGSIEHQKKTVLRNLEYLSGHYRPGKQNLLDCLNALSNRYQVDLRTCTIMDQSQQDDNWRSAYQYLILNGRPPLPLRRRK